MTPDTIREQLERMLASETFAGAGRHSRLLRYLVERTLAGEGDRLKEYVLGTEVFDRTESYDPRIDSIVRVEARRLRSRLEEYYRGPGKADRVLISIPRGSYTPVFAPSTQAPAAIPPASAEPAGDGARSRPFAMLVAAAVLTLLVIGAVSRIGPVRAPTAQASAMPAIAVLPFQHFSTSPADAMLAARITDTVAFELARLRMLAVASRTSSSQYSTDNRSVHEIRDALGVDFVMEATAEHTGGAWRATVRVVDATLDRKIWVGEYTMTPADFSRVARQIALEASEGTLNYQARQVGR